jgi:transcription antitermination factor NusG
MIQFTPVLVPARKWYAIATRARYDKKVILALQRKKIEVFCPLVKIKKQYWDGAVSAQNEPLFPSLLFVRLADHEIHTVIHTDGVMHFLYWLDSFAVISEKDINTISDFIRNYEKVRIEKITLEAAKINFGSGLRETLKPNLEKATKKTLTSIGYDIITTDFTKQEQVVAV